MNVINAERLARDLMNAHGLEGWVFRLDDARRRFGCCRYDRREISLSRHLVALNSIADVEETILHEIAHALAGRTAGHGPRWAEICIRIGGNGQRCYKPDWAGGTIAQPVRRVVLTADMLSPTKG